MREIPLNTERYKTPQESKVLDRARQEIEKYEENGELLALIDDGYFQIGSLGGGNHFIELQEDEEGYLCIMIHSGSRHLGKAVCDYFHEKARQLNRLWYSEVKDEYRLAFLPAEAKNNDFPGMHNCDGSLLPHRIPQYIPYVFLSVFLQ